MSKQELPTKEALAERFVAVLKTWLTAEQLEEVKLLNSKETNPLICHSQTSRSACSGKPGQMPTGR